MPKDFLKNSLWSVSRGYGSLCACDARLLEHRTWVCQQRACQGVVTEVGAQTAGGASPWQIRCSSARHLS